MTTHTLCRWGLSAVLLTWLSTLGGAARAEPQNVVSELASRKDLHLTVYRAGRRDTAFLREVREVEIPAGTVRIALRGVPDTVQRESVTLRVVQGPPLQVLEQTFAYDLMTPASLLRAAQGTDISVDVAGVHDGRLHPLDVHVMATGREGTVVRTREGYTYGLDPERSRFASVPATLTPRPTLTWQARSETAGKRRIEISYLLTGMHWSADYVATLSRDGRRLDLSGWVTLKNETAARFEHTHLAVAAGSIHRAPLPQHAQRPRKRTAALEEITINGKVAREALAHLHLYKIAEPTDLAPLSMKNVHLLSLTHVPTSRMWITRFYVRPSGHENARTERPRLRFEMRNDEAFHAGIPIPAGTVRVMVPDRRGTPHMVAQSSVVDTPKGQRLRIDVGPASDIKVRLIPKDYQRTLLGARRATYALVLRNGSSHAGVVRVDLQPGSFTQIDVQGAKVARPSAATWRVDVPLGARATRTLRVVATVERPRR